MNNPGVLMLIFGGGFAVIGGLMLRQQIRLRRKGVRVMGTVTRIEEQTMRGVTGADRAPSTTYKPVVRFHTQAGEEIETVTNVGMPWAGHPAGEAVPVMYDPADPAHAEIDTSGRRGLLTLLGLLMLLGGLALVVVGIMRLIQA